MKAFLLVGLFAPIALATTLIKADVSTLTRQSDAVVLGKVGAVTSRFTSDHLRIMTDAEISVSQTLKGQVGSTVVVMQPGGEVGDVGQRVAGVAHFAPGEEVLVFLEKRGERFFVVGMVQGKFRIQRSSDGKAAFALPPDELDASLVDPLTHEATHADGGPIQLERLVQQIVAATATTAPAPAVAPARKLEKRP